MPSKAAEAGSPHHPWWLPPAYRGQQPHRRAEPKPEVASKPEEFFRRQMSWQQATQQRLAERRQVDAGSALSRWPSGAPNGARSIESPRDGATKPEANGLKTPSEVKAPKTPSTKTPSKMKAPSGPKTPTSSSTT